MSSKHKSFKVEIQRLSTQPGVEAKGYYHITRLADDSGLLLQSVDSHWCGYTETRPRREIREASLSDGPGLRAILHRLGQTCLLVNDATDFRLWLAFGGHAVILEGIAKSRLPTALSPREVARASGAMGYIAADSLSDAQRQHVPSRVTRMKVLNRDGRRCFICGRSPVNHVDIELHVHHIVPWGTGGITESENLVTLCSTCHDGLDPHFDWDLVQSVKEKHYAEPGTEYFKGLRNYQQKIKYFLRTKKNK